MRTNLTGYKAAVVESKGFLDEGIPYEWTVDRIEVLESVVMDRDAPTEARGKEYGNLSIDLKKKINPDKLSDSLKMYLTATHNDSDIRITFSMPLGKNLKIVPDNPAFTSKVVIFLQKIGQRIEPDSEIRLDIIKPGLKFCAEVVQKANKFHEIVLDSVAPAGSNGGNGNTESSEKDVIGVVDRYGKDIDALNEFMDRNRAPLSLSNADARNFMVKKLANEDPMLVVAFNELLGAGLIKILRRD